MSDYSRVELIMANLVETLRQIPGVRGVIDEAPREHEQAQPFTAMEVPFVWVWEGEELPDATQSTDHLHCPLPVTVEAVFVYEPNGANGLRRRGRRLKAQIQAALAADVGRGRDPETGAPQAFDTLERSNLVGMLPEMGYGCVRLEYEITYLRRFTSPYEQ